MDRCAECGKEFATAGALTQHLKDRHGVESPRAGPATDEPTRQVKRPKSLRRRNRHPVAIGLIGVGVALFVGFYLVAAPSFAAPPFPCSSGGTYDHVHPYLQIWVNGRNVTIPADVGILSGGTCTQPIHTHDSSGVLHLELSQSEAAQNWTLANFFSIWKFSCSQRASDCPTVNGTAVPVEFSQTSIFGLRTDATHSLVLLVDGTPSTLWGSLNLLEYDYCNSTIGSGFPCQTADGNPEWQGGASYPYQTGNKIIIEYSAV